MLLGQSIMISPKGLQVWLDLMKYLVQHYRKDGYETLNTGPDGVTAFFNRKGSCERYRTKAILGLLQGPFSVHHATGSWRTASSLRRKKGLVGALQSTALEEASCFIPTTAEA